MSRDEDNELLPRSVLDAWEVPAPPSDLEDAIMKGIDMTRAGKPSVAERTASTLIVPLIAGLAAAALVLVWLATTRERPGPTQPPAPVAAPVPAVAPVKPATPEAVATLVVDVGPVGARVTVDGKPLDGPAPFIATAMPVGEHRVAVEAPGHLPVERTLDLPAGTTEIPIKLASKVVTISVDVSPPDAALALIATGDDGPRRTDVGPVIEVERTSGTHYAVSASAPGYQTRELQIGFDGSPVQRMAIALPPDPDAPVTRKRRSAPPAAPTPPPPPAVGKATLRIGTNMGAPPAKVYVDGKMIGTTPQTDVQVTAGRHTVKWMWPSGRTVTQGIVLEAGAVKIAKAG